MTLLQLTAVAITASLAGGLLGLGMRARFWLHGRRTPTDLLAGLRDLPRRYLVDVHHAVARQPRTARMHVFAAPGFLATLLALTLAWPWPAVGAFLAIPAGLALGIGALLDLKRRQDDRHVSMGPYRVFPLALGAFALGIATSGIADLLAAEGTLLRAATILLLGPPVLYVGWSVCAGPLRHAPIGALHLAAHPRPERFADRGRGSALRPLDLDAPRLGAGDAADYPWNAILGFDACVQCGKCEAVCPAFAAGQPLNPKALIDQLSAEAGLRWQPYAGNWHPGRPANEAAIADETHQSCTTCRACVEACPMLIEHVDAIVERRRFQTLEAGNIPPNAAKVLRALIDTGNQGGMAPQSRSLWTAGLSVPVAQPGVPVDVLLWQGEGAYQPQGRRVLRALVQTFRAADVSFATLGSKECDCGDLARRIGAEDIFAALASRTIATLEGLAFNRIVTADPHALHTLRNEYPSMGGNWTVVHHTEILTELLESGLLVNTPNLSVTYHDPCYLARYNSIVDAPRSVLKALGAEVTEMVRHGTSARCCGGGGAAPVFDIPGERRIPDMRMQDAAETGAGLVAVACPGCAAMLSGVTDAGADVRDIAELVADALSLAEAGAA